MLKSVSYQHILESLSKTPCKTEYCVKKPKRGCLYCSECVDFVKDINNSSNNDMEELPEGIYWIYFIKIDGLEPIKIGKTRNIKQRIDTLSTGCPAEYLVLAKFAAYSHVEFVLHERFKGHRVKGEWFDPCRDLLNLIIRIDNGDTPDYLNNLTRKD